MVSLDNPSGLSLKKALIKNYQIKIVKKKNKSFNTFLIEKKTID